MTGCRDCDLHYMQFALSAALHNITCLCLLSAHVAPRGSRESMKTACHALTTQPGHGNLQALSSHAQHTCWHSLCLFAPTASQLGIYLSECVVRAVGDDEACVNVPVGARLCQQRGAGRNYHNDQKCVQATTQGPAWRTVCNTAVCDAAGVQAATS